MVWQGPLCTVWVEQGTPAIVLTPCFPHDCDLESVALPEPGEQAHLLPWRLPASPEAASILVSTLGVGGGGQGAVLESAQSHTGSWGF